MITLRAVTTDDLVEFRDTRLRALRDTPLAFGSTFARESAFTETQWKERIGQWVSGRSTALLARDGESCCGIVAGFRDEEDAMVVHLVSMWVDPATRKSGVGRRLVEAIAAWAHSIGANEVRLMVTSVNEAAMAFYERLGFEKTGRIEPYPNDERIVEFEMSRTLRV